MVTQTQSRTNTVFTIILVEKRRRNYTNVNLPVKNYKTVVFDSSKMHNKILLYN